MVLLLIFPAGRGRHVPPAVIFSAVMQCVFIIIRRIPGEVVPVAVAKVVVAIQARQARITRAIVQVAKGQPQQGSTHAQSIA